MSSDHPFHTLLPPQIQPLWRRGMKLSGNPHRADDLVQATLMKAWANRDKFQPDSNLRAWLFTILRNTFLSDLRKGRWEVEDVNDVAAKSLYEPARQEDSLALGELLTAVAALPKTQGWPILLTGAYGYSQIEASEVCGCTIGTIKSRVSRGRSALSRVLAQDDVSHRGRTLGSVRLSDPSKRSTGSKASCASRNPSAPGTGGAQVSAQ